MSLVIPRSSRTENLRNSKKILDLLRLIAFQIGREVFLRELGQKVDLSHFTVERYLDLLEKTFVLKNLCGFSRNLRSEISKTSRYYFYDPEIRNAVKAFSQASFDEIINKK